jgi:hypothetical protein
MKITKIIIIITKIGIDRKVLLFNEEFNSPYGSKNLDKNYCYGPVPDDG